MWYFDSGNNDCLSFAYSGCGGNENRFPSRSACREACKPDTLLSVVKSGSLEQEEEYTKYISDTDTIPTDILTLEEEETPEDESLETDPPRESLGIFPPLVYNLTNFSPQAVGMLNTVTVLQNTSEL